MIDSTKVVADYLRQQAVQADKIADGTTGSIRENWRQTAAAFRDAATSLTSQRNAMLEERAAIRELVQDSIRQNSDPENEFRKYVKYWMECLLKNIDCRPK